MRLISEELREGLKVDSVLNEETGKKELYIKGIFLQQEQKNRNGRVYPAAVMEGAVKSYIDEYVTTKRAIGELNHPTSPVVNPANASHLITNIVQEGNNYIGTAKILDTPMGQIVRGLVEGGVQLGVSSRGVGSLKEENGVNVVQNDFKMFTVDVVGDPSATDAWVNGIYESAEWVWDNGALVEHEVQQIVDIMEQSPVDNTEAQIKAFSTFMSLIKAK